MKKIITDRNLANLEQNDLILCHGTFDYFHIGHLSYLKFAKTLKGKLVVSLTADRFVNKGPSRPIFSQSDRAELIAELSIVDYVVINNAPTAVELIKLLKPRFYVKGPDYKNNEDDKTGMIVKEVEAVREHGGEVIYAETKKYISTELIRELNIE